MKQLILAAIFLQAIPAHSESYDVLDYSMLTNYMNYNPKYDYYPGLAMIGKSQVESETAGFKQLTAADQVPDRRSQIQAELAQLDREWRQTVNAGMNSSMGGFLTNSLMANQTRFRMKQLNDELVSLNGGNGGCGSRGGPGYRKANGQCAGW